MTDTDRDQQPPEDTKWVTLWGHNPTPFRERSTFIPCLLVAGFAVTAWILTQMLIN